MKTSTGLFVAALAAALLTLVLLAVAANAQEVNPAPEVGAINPAPALPGIYGQPCRGDYLFCLQRLIAEQTTRNDCINTVEFLAEHYAAPLPPLPARTDIYDTFKMPDFKTVSECQAHTGACGYTLLAESLVTNQCFSALGKLVKPRVGAQPRK